MNANDKLILKQLTEIVDQIVAGTGDIETKLRNVGTSESAELNSLKEKIISLGENYAEGYEFIVELSKGNLDISPPCRNSFLNPYKQLHAELRHLTWQIMQIAEGDYDQQVYFLGDFSRAINKMILALRERQILADKNKRNEEQLMLYTNELKELNATKDKLFSIIAHDLKNPFNALMGFSDILLREMKAGNNTGVANECAKAIYNSAAEGYDLLVNLLEWSRQQSGKIVVTPDPQNINTIIRHNIKVAGLAALSKNITISFEDNNNYIVNTDAAILNTVLRNLISNAVKYTPNNGHVEISLERQPDNSYWISVKDSGVGIEPNDLTKLFRTDIIHTTRGTNNEGGTGLGLILCKDFVSKLGGDIWVTSKVKEGTTFTFSIKDIQ